MSRRTIQSNHQLYSYSPDDPVLVGTRTWGVISALLTDEITSLQPNGSPFISTNYRGLHPRVAQESGMVGLVGIPVRVFPNLKNQEYTVEFTVGAEGYIPRTKEAKLPKNTSFPDSFTPATLLELELHRPAVAIRGRTVKVAGNSTEVLPGATVELTGIWLTIASTRSTSQPVNMLALRPPLYFDRSTRIGKVRRRVIKPVPGDDKTLLADAQAGTARLRLSDALNIRHGDLLIVDYDDPERTEYMTIDSITSAATRNQPATIQLTSSLAYRHLMSAPVRRSIKLLVDAPAGSTRLRLSAALDTGHGDLLIVDYDDPERTEYMTIDSITDAAIQGQPATFHLTHSLAYMHRAGAAVQRGVVQSTARFTKSFDQHRNALTGDSVVFLNNITNVRGAGVVEITGGSQPREFHNFRTYSTTTDDSGYFRLPPISRVAQVQLEATHPQHAAIPPKRVNPQYGGADNWVDFVFR